MEHTLHIDGHRMVAQGFNEDFTGTPVIFLHGIMSSLDFWIAGQSAIFNEHFRWYTLSLPGHYPAALPADFQRADLTAETIARVVAGAVEQLTGGEPALLVGHSTGGFAALATAAYAPQIVKAVVSISGFAKGQWGGMLSMLQRLARGGEVGERMFRGNLRLPTSHPALYRASLRFYAADSGALYRNEYLDASLERLYPNATRLDLTAMAHYFNRMPSIDIGEWLPRIDVPLLAVTGDRDPIVPPDESARIAENAPQGELVLIAGAGHLPMVERRAAYDAIIDGWVQRQFAEQVGAAVMA
jgi:pimeloyl-ACP methyl ester carboxylesterase